MSRESLREYSRGQGWTRVSSFKPHVAGVILIVVAVCLLGLLFGGKESTLALLTSAAAVALGLIAINSKVVYKRGNDYRVSTIYYSEIVTVEDVCMTVTRQGPFWPRFRIHLRRPARFGWAISFAPTEVTPATPINRAEPKEA